MIFLLFAIISSTSISLILKYSESKNLNRYAVTSFNYIAAFTASIILTVSKSEGGIFRGVEDVVGLGIFAGILYFLGFIFIQKSIKENGVGITGAVSKTGIILPVVLSMILWREIPGALQSAGVVLSISAIIMININPKDIRSFKSYSPTIVLLFFIAGIAEFTTKLFERSCLAQNKPLYLFIIFFTAFCISVYFTHSSWKKGKKITKTDVMTGLFVGIPNMLASFFLIESFSHFKASVAFPIYSAGTILLISLGGILIFKEKMKRKDILAIMLIIVSIVLMNIE